MGPGDESNTGVHGLETDVDMAVRIVILGSLALAAVGKYVV